MSTPRHARRRGARGASSAGPIVAVAVGGLLLGAAAVEVTGGTGEEPPLGLDVAEVRQAHRPTGTAMPAQVTADGTATSGASVHGSMASGASVQGPTRSGASVHDPAGTGARPLVVHHPVAVSLPSLELEAPVIHLGLNGLGGLEVPGDPAVAGWWTGGPAPGEDGAAVLAGHVDSEHGPGVFWRLAELVPGDHIVVHGADGTSLTFVVDGVGRWPKSEFPTDAVYRQADGAELRLITCGGQFDRSARSYRDNVVVFATAT